MNEDTSKPRYLLFLSEVCGEIAAQAVRMSPHPCPEGLERVVDEFSRRMLPVLRDRPDFVAHGCAGKGGLFSTLPDEVGAFLDAHLLSQPIVKRWNERKNGKQGHQFTSRYDAAGTDPDDDFVDLDALRRNILRELFSAREMYDPSAPHSGHG